MISLLIIDDEPIIVDSMESLMAEISLAQVVVHKAYTAAEAMRCLEAGEIHVVLSDIKMPGMNGIELQREIGHRWPRCKVIFLTGYSDYHYMQAAIRNDAADYLLKTEDNETILHAVEKAIKALLTEQSKQEDIDKSRREEKARLPIFQSAFMSALLQAARPDPIDAEMQIKLKRLEIPLVIHTPVLLLFAKVEKWKEGFSHFDQSLMGFAIQNIAGELLQETAAMFSFAYDAGKLVWLVQVPEATPAADNETVSAKQREQCRNRVMEKLPSIQASCKRYLGLKLTFVITREWVDWHALAGRFERLKVQLSRGLTFGEDLLLPDSAHENETGGAGSEHRRPLQKAPRMDLFLQLLEDGDRTTFVEKLAQTRELIVALPQPLNAYKIEQYYALALMFISYMNKWRIQTEIAGKINLTQLYSLDFSSSNSEVFDYFGELADAIFEQQSERPEDRENAFVAKVHQFIAERLAEDLSLDIIGDSIGYNPSYLSRVYKQATGIGLTDYIMGERIVLAKELLRQPKYKIQEVATSAGFLTVPYFYRIFKRDTGMTPQDYRTLYLEAGESPNHVKKG